MESLKIFKGIKTRKIRCLENVHYQKNNKPRGAGFLFSSVYSVIHFGLMSPNFQKDQAAKRPPNLIPNQRNEHAFVPLVQRKFTGRGVCAQLLDNYNLFTAYIAIFHVYLTLLVQEKTCIRYTKFYLSCMYYKDGKLYFIKSVPTFSLMKIHSL